MVREDESEADVYCVVPLSGGYVGRSSLKQLQHGCGLGMGCGPLVTSGTIFFFYQAIVVLWLQVDGSYQIYPDRACLREIFSLRPR